MGKFSSRDRAQKTKYSVSGMHCASCEVLVEKKVLHEKGVKSVQASLKNDELTIHHTSPPPTKDELNEMFKDDGYTFTEVSDGKGKGKDERESPPLISFKNGSLFLSREKAANLLWIVGIALLAVIGVYLLGRSGLSSMVSVTQSSSLPAFFLFGLLAGASSCAALVGGLVLSMSKQWSEIYGDDRSSLPHLSFNAGRMISFALLGSVLGAVGGFLSISPNVYAVITIGVAVMMIMLALQMLGVKAFQKFQLTMPKALTRYVADETNFKGKYMPFVLGALTFFLPCGFTITAQGMALASGSAFQGGLIMLAFALGTVPMLVIIGLTSAKLSNLPRLSGRFLKIAGVIVLVFAGYMINSQLNVLGVSSVNDVGIRADSEDAGDLVPLVDGVQVMEMEADASTYTPNYFKVRAGVPVRWEITNTGVSGCTNAIISRGLFDGEISIDDDVVSKEFTAEEPGTYKFSCWMGMVTGTIEVVGEDGSVGETETIDSVPSGADSSGCGCSGS
jgi:uncharacterized protein